MSPKRQQHAVGKMKQGKKKKTRGPPSTRQGEKPRGGKRPPTNKGGAPAVETSRTIEEKKGETGLPTAPLKQRKTTKALGECRSTRLGGKKATVTATGDGKNNKPSGNLRGSRPPGKKDRVNAGSKGLGSPSPPGRCIKRHQGVMLGGITGNPRGERKKCGNGAWNKGARTRLTRSPRPHGNSGNPELKRSEKDG